MKTFIYTTQEKPAGDTTKVTLSIYRVKNNLPTPIGEVVGYTHSWAGNIFEVRGFLSDNKLITRKESKTMPHSSTSYRIKEV